MMDSSSSDNPCGLRGIAFMEFCASRPGVEQTLTALGFARIARHRHAAVDTFAQHQIRFLLNLERRGHAAEFAAAHGASVCGIGFEVEDARLAYATALARGARPCAPGRGHVTLGLPAVEGVGDGLIYFVERPQAWFDREFRPHPMPVTVAPRGFIGIDHFTHNVATGELAEIVHYYTSVFGFGEIRAFDIRGRYTGLRSSALRSPDGSFCVPINEATGEHSQIAEYLRDHNGPGVQHIALLTDDLLGVLDQMIDGPLRFLDIDPSYYDHAFERVPMLREPRADIVKHRVLVDGDEHGYILQIFTGNLVGPMFIEFIQRENHTSFGEGNFAGLFRAIEREQEARGVLAGFLEGGQAGA